MRRTIIGFLVCPVIIPLETFVLAIIKCSITSNGPPGCYSRAAVVSLFYALYTVPIGWLVNLVLAVPCYLILKKLNRANLVTLSIVGILSGLAITLPGAINNKVYGPIGAYFVLYGCFFGFSTAVVFWWIAVRTRRDA